MTITTKHQLQVRPGQTWSERNPRLGTRVFIVQAVQDEGVLMRTVYDEGLIGVRTITVPLLSLLAQQACWHFVSEPIHHAQ